MLKINMPQNRQLHDLLGEKKLNWMKQKPALVNAYTDGRTASSKEMTMQEAEQLIKYLQGQWDARRPAGKKHASDAKPQVSESTARQRRTIIGLVKDLGWTWKNPQGWVMGDLKRMDRFFLQDGVVKKKMMDMDERELNRAITQLRSMLANNSKTAFNKEFNKMRKDLDV